MRGQEQYPMTAHCVLLAVICKLIKISVEKISF